MTHTTLLSRLKAVGIDPSLFTAEELAAIAQSADAEYLHAPPLHRQAIPAPESAELLLGEIRSAAQHCLNAVSGHLLGAWESQKQAATIAAEKIGREFPTYLSAATDFLARAEKRRTALMGAIDHVQNNARELVCLHSAARISRKNSAADTLRQALGQCEAMEHEYTDALCALDVGMQALSSIVEADIPALLDTAAPLFNETDGRAFSPAAFRAAALHLRDICSNNILC